MLKSMLIKNNPWPHEPCLREKCAPCASDKEMKGTGCNKRSIIYSTTCNICKLMGKKVQYLGESSRAMMERTREHLEDAGAMVDENKKKRKSHIREHWEDAHGGRKTEFIFKLEKRCRSAFERQLTEAVLISSWKRQGITLLNDKEEYNRCLIHELVVHVGKSQK